MQERIDGGWAYDFGKTAAEYARYRDIYPASLYEKLVLLGVGKADQRILDLGTGTGVLPRAMAATGARFTGIDPAPEQIAQAEELSAGLGIQYRVAPAEDTGCGDGSMDLATACQSFHYFDKARLLPEMRRVLVPGGKLCVIFMEWLPREDTIAREMEELVLQYNPNWSGGGFAGFRYCFPAWAEGVFEMETVHCYREVLRFTKENWLGRVRTCRGVGASLPPETVAAFDAAYRSVLAKCPGDSLEIPHQLQIELYRML